MFERPDDSYQIDTVAIDRILADESNPLRLISDLIPEGAKVLDVGAGNGVLSLLLQRLNKRVVIHGIEPSPAAAAMAAQHYEVFIKGTLDNLPEPGSGHHDASLNENSYDYIVFADVIEHTTNPIALLQEASRHLSEQGKIVVSVPNVSFAPIRAALMAGQWEYTDWGILERTHLRFFSKTGLLQALDAANLSVHQFVHMGRSPFQMEKQLQDYPLDLLSLLRLKKDPLAFTYQFLAVCSSDRDVKTSAPAQETWIGIDSQHFVRRYLQLRKQRLKPA